MDWMSFATSKTDTMLMDNNGSQLKLLGDKIQANKIIDGRTLQPRPGGIRNLEAEARSHESIRFKEQPISTFIAPEELPPCIFPQYKPPRQTFELLIEDPVECRPNPDEPSYMRIYKELVCKEEKDETAEQQKLKEPDAGPVSTSIQVSQKMIDTHHMPSMRTRDRRSEDTVLMDSELCIGCAKPENEINFMGGLGPCCGNKRSDKHPQRPTTIQKIFRMRTGNYPLMSLTENPRQAHCPVPRHGHHVKQLKQILEKVELADNVDTPTASTSSIVECENFDLENPLNLDLQGRDYRQTYEKDEQEIQNAREYYHQLLHMKRRLMKAEIAKLSEEKQRKQEYATPEFFNIDTDFEETDQENKKETAKEEPKEKPEETPYPIYKKASPEEIPLDTEPEAFAQLYRTTTKKENQAVIETELSRRIDRYYQLWLTRKNKEQEAAEKRAEEIKLKEENLIFDLGEQFFEDLLKDKYQECLEMYKNLPPIHVKRQYPHTLRETKNLKKKMAESRKIIEDKAVIATEQFERQGIQRKANQLSTDFVPIPGVTENEVSLSEQSTDDEDALEVGKVDEETYKLRGFHYKLDTEPRGLIDRKHKTKEDRPERTCQSRSSWFRQLVPNVSPPAFFQYNPSSLKRTYLPTDPNINLFQTKLKPIKEVEKAPIREYLENPPPHAYAQRKEVRLKVKKPKYTKVKKFNLTGYMYGARKQKRLRDSTEETAGGKSGVFEKFFKQAEAYADSKRKERHVKRHRRLRYLGIPYNKKAENLTKDPCETSETESSEWIPNDDQQQQIQRKTSIENASKENLGRSTYELLKHHMTIADMPAPKFREPTLRNHPRRPRLRESESFVYDNFSADSVSIVTLRNEARTKTRKVSPRAPYDVPRLVAIKPDAVLPPNLKMKKSAYTQLFDARHHHSHADPTDHRTIRVRYTNKLPDLNEEEKVASAKVSKQKRPFEKAYPRGKDYKERDLSLPQIKYKLDTKKPETMSVEEVASAKKVPSTVTLSNVQEKKYKSREAYKDNLPGKSEYIDSIRKMATELRRELENIKESGNEFIVNEEEYADEIMKEIESIKSCVTSLESSICTNFTNDSGSYMMIQDKKIPCDYITKSFVPFEEIDRVRIKAARADAVDEYNAPYYTVPFSGQKQDQINLAKPADKFFTYTQRARTGIRKRLEVKTPDFKTELLGGKNFKAASRLATEWDENYQHELRNRPTVAPFKRKTSMIMLRDGVRKKFETLYIRGQITEQQIIQQKEAEYAQEVIKLRDMCHELFQKWQERHYHLSMLTIEKIKPFYHKTDILKKNFQELEREMIKLNMRIVFTEDDWIRRTILQNFHYLIMEQSWRLEHDWIHLQEDGTLENFRTSINNRRFVNIRKRDRDDAWAIKEYYENVYLKRSHPIEIVFPDAQTFNEGVIKLKVRTFICLLELHFSMWVLANLQQEYNQFTQNSGQFIDHTTKFVKNRGANRYFMEDRAKKLEVATRELIDEPLLQSVGSPRMRTIEPLCDMIYVKVIPQHIRNDVKEDCSAIDKLQMIFGHLMDVIGKLDNIPTKKRQQIEKAYRKNQEYSLMQSQQACLIEKRILLALEEIKRNMTPPYQKPLRTGKLPRVFFKKKKVLKKEKPKVISEKNQLFIQAFTASDDEEGQIESGQDSEILNSLQDNCIPFYFDHFLKLHDYEPNYDFQTQVEINDGPEEQRLFYKDVLADVMTNLEAWQLAKQKKMEADIQKTLYLYVDDDTV